MSDYKLQRVIQPFVRLSHGMRSMFCAAPLTAALASIA